MKSLYIIICLHIELCPLPQSRLYQISEMALFSSKNVAGPERTLSQVVKAANAPCRCSGIVAGPAGIEARVLVMVSTVADTA